MSRTLLQLVQQAADELGIPQPSAIVGIEDDQSRQLLALAIREGKEFSTVKDARGGWQNLYKEYVFQTNVLNSTTGNTTEGSAVITNIPSTTGITAETFFVSGNDIPYQAKVVSVDSSSQVTLDRPVESTQTGVSLTFAQGGYALPSDFEYFAQKTFWDNAYRWEILGPISAQEKQILRYGVSVSGPRRKFYLRGNKLFLDPIPSTDGEVIAFDYYSNAWCESSGGTAQTYWQADADIYKLDEDVFVLGLKWRFLRAKGLDYSQEKMDYDMEVRRVISRDGSAPDLPLNRRTVEIGEGSIPDTGFGT